MKVDKILPNIKILSSKRELLGSWEHILCTHRS